MKAKLLKKLRKRFAWTYDHKSVTWLIVDGRYPIFNIKPLLDYTPAECMMSVYYGSSSVVGGRRTRKDIKVLFREMIALTALVQTYRKKLTYNKQ